MRRDPSGLEANHTALNESYEETQASNRKSTANNSQVQCLPVTQASNLTYLKISTESTEHERRCLVCDKSFESSSNLHVHMSIQHKGHRPYRCEFCGKSFTQIDTMRVHQTLGHSDLANPYSCTMCKQQVGSSHDLAEHMKSIHQKTHKCRWCIKCFSRLNELVKHETTHNNAKNRSQPNDRCDDASCPTIALEQHKERVLDGQQHLCPLCEDTFTRTSDMNTHIYEHIEESPFECPDCSELFENLEIFQSHMRSHNNSLNITECSQANRVESKNDDSNHSYNDLIASAETFNSNDDKDTPVIESDLARLGVKITYPILNYDNEFSGLLDSEHSAICHQAISKPNTSPTKAVSGALIDINPQISMKKTEKPTKSRAPVSLAWQQRDNKIRNFTCKICEKSFTLASTLTLHFRRTHLGIKPYECKVCGWTFAQTSDLIKHMRKHTGERPFMCPTCGLGFSQNRNLKNHMKMHTEAPSKCIFCKKEFLLETSLTQHLKKHEGPDAVKCEFCFIPFTIARDLEVHIRRLHSDGKSYKCAYCDKAFHKSHDLKKHNRIHTGDRPYLCKYALCEKTFAHPTSLRNHQIVHTGERPFQCSTCGQAFSFAGNLNAHIRAHTGEKPYECKVCLKRFARTANLREHIKIHTNLREHKCDICQKSFTNSSTFSKHKKIHTGEKPYKCQLCDKAFIQVAHLTKHFRTHTGEKPYECHLCKKHFRRSDTLANHLKTHRKEVETKIPDQTPPKIDAFVTPLEREPLTCTPTTTSSYQQINDNLSPILYTITLQPQPSLAP